jgi:hypothetical protein
VPNQGVKSHCEKQNERPLERHHDTGRPSKRARRLMPMKLTAEQVEQYHQEGYLFLPDYFASADMGQLLRVARDDEVLASIANDRLDREGRTSRLSLRHELPDDAYAAYTRSCAIVEPMEQLMGCEVWHYHHKMMMKEPHTGGAWEWHQDFGYWHSNFLYPDMASCLIAVDRAHKANGCLQVLKGSHRMGRLEHGRAGDQTGADPDRIAAVEDRFDRVYCEMTPGTVLFFHSNLLHRSDANQSPDSRWALICCYTSSENPPFREGTKGEFSRIERWDDERVKRSLREHETRQSDVRGN